MNTIFRWPLLLLMLLAMFPAQDAERRPISPFRGMRAVEAGIEVQVHDDTWVGLESIAGVDTATLLKESKRLYGPKAWKRLTEDLPVFLDAIGHKVGESVDVKVRDLESKEVRTLTAVKMTRENRQRLLEANRAAEGSNETRKERAALSAEDARADLAALRVLLDEEFAYRELRQVDLAALLKQESDALGTGTVPRETLALAVDRILRAFGDGHSRVDATPSSSEVFLPCLVQAVEGGHVAFLADRSGLVDAERPFLTHIDEVPLERWLAAAQARGTQGSTAMQMQEAERGLRELGELRRVLELPAAPEVKLTLRGKSDAKQTSLPVASKKPIYGAWPRSQTRLLEGNIGYLRIEQMKEDADFLDGLDVSMSSFRDSQGLIIDVRGNGGGTRDALRRLAPYFLAKDGAAVIGNVAAVLLTKSRPAQHDTLADRGLYAAEWSGWTPPQRDAIKKFAASFKPSWVPPAAKFSGWNYLVLDRADNPKAWPYEKRVVVLVDRGCFSATDIFAAALGVLPQVTLVGESTSGGSGRAKTHVLPRSGVGLQLSTMASFRPDGVLFEGTGVEPDVVVKAAPEDLIGRSDAVLKRAQALLRK